MPQPSSSSPLLSIWEKIKRNEATRIAALGDSLTYGWEASFSYFDLFISKLRSDFCGVNITGFNAGVCGDTAAGGLNRLHGVLSQKPDLLIVEFGINDLYTGVALHNFRDSLGAIAQTSIRSHAVPLFITSGPLLYPEQQRDIAPYYKVLREVAKSYECPVADIADYWHKHYHDFHNFYFEDGVHPNDAGYRSMADALYILCQEINTNWGSTVS